MAGFGMPSRADAAAAAATAASTAASTATSTGASDARAARPAAPGHPGDAADPRAARGGDHARGGADEGMAPGSDRRRWRLRSIGLRIVLPVALASVALVGLGLVQTGGAVAQGRAAERAGVLARLASSAAALVHHVELEYAETNALRQRGGSAGAQLLTAAQARADAARARFDSAARATRRAVPALRPAVDAAADALTLLPAARDLAPGSPDGSVELLDLYDEITERLIAVADAVPAQLSDPKLVETARSVVLVTELEHLAARQLDLLRRVFNRQRMEAGELVRLAGWAGGERQRREEIGRLTGPPRIRFAELVTGVDVERAARLRDLVLLSDGGAQSLRADPDVWYVAQSGLLRRLRIIQVELSGGMEAEANRIHAAARARTLATAGATLAVVVGTLAGAVVLAVRTSRRLRQLRHAGLALARAELPEAISRVADAGDAGAVRDAVQESSSRIDAVLASGTDEIGDLGDAFGAVHRRALRLAADQALLRMEVEAIFVALSRRGQTLAQRQLNLIDEFGRAEADPQRLGRLYALDHLAARMRRNEENLLVLAGGEPGRRFLSPVPVIDAISAAIEEVEEPARVELTGAPGVAVVAPAAGDLIHLLAELLENAITFSPPTTKVRVAARQTVESANITVFDEGIGMPADKLAEANGRLTRPSALTSTLVGTMGLLVVARLAQRHGIRVRLSSAPGGGTAATVTVPDAMLAPAPVADPLLRGRWRGTVGAAARGSAAGGAAPASTGPADSGARTPAGSPAFPAGRAPAFPTATGQPPTGPSPTGPSPTGLRPSGLRPTGPSPIGQPPTGLPPAVRGGPPEGGVTAAGLPRRVAGANAIRPGAATALTGLTPAGPATGGHQPPPGPPDPDAARARLASLASGIAAAQRRTPAAGAPPALPTPADPAVPSPPSRRQDSP